MEEASKEVKAKGIFETVARADVGQKVDIGKIQDQLAEYLGITEKSEHRASQLKARLSKGDTILVILDDVWSEIPFTEIGIPFGDSSIKGCKILLTSRLRDVCIHNNCKDPVKIEALTEEEAWDMFTKTVDISTIESVNDDSLARQVCKKCARLPLIIAAVGKALHKKCRDIWEDALHQLVDCKPEKIEGIPPLAYACLRWSFNILDKDAYLCLLLCSLVGEDEEIRIEFLFRLATGSGLLEDWNTYTLECARKRVNAMVSVLKSSSLLLEGRDYDSVKLHDIIRDVARSITHDKESEYEFLSESNCHSFWRKEDILSSRKLIYLDFKSDDVYFPDDPVLCPDLHTLYLKYCNLSDVQPPDSFFKSFPKLKYLLLDIKSLSAMPSSIQHLDSLRSLAIHSCKVNDISHIIQLKNLEMLSLQNSCFGGQLLDFRQLRRLRMLDLLWCTEIMGTVLSGLVCLEELYLPIHCNILDGETKRKTTLSSMTSKLKSLEIHFEDVKSCPDEIFCKNLCRYKIYVGRTRFSTFGVHGSAMKSVYLCNDSIGGGVKTLVESGEAVILERVTGLQECFSQGGGAFTDLKWLVIRECTGGDEYLSRIHRQPHERVGPFSNLSDLRISNSGFKYLFCISTARCLQQLKMLQISSCVMMEEIVRNECQINEFIYFPELRYLRLNSLPVFKSLCGKVVFLALESLYISNMDNITEIWEEHDHLQESFYQLKCLEVRSCHKLKNVIPYDMRQRLQNLNTLHVFQCDSLISEVQGPNGAEIAEPLVVLPNLKELELCELPKLMETGLNSSDIILYPNLTSLVIDRCNKLRNVFLPSAAGHLKLLELLRIISCEMMNAIIAPVGKDGEEIRVNNIKFPMLKRLELHQLPKMNSLWGYGIVEPNLDQQKSSQACKISFPSLEDLSFGGLKINLEQIYLGRDLESLNVSNCNFHECDLFSLLGNSSWKNNPYGTISFRRLRTVEVNSCMLSTIFTCSVAKALQELKELEVISCGLIKEIVTDEQREDQLVVDTCEEISFPKLRVVTLEGLPNLKSFCPSANYCFKMPSLEYVKIMGCPQMLSFTPRQINTPEVYVSIEYPSLDGEGYTTYQHCTTDINSYLHQIMNTQELFVDKKEELKPNPVDKGKSIVTS